MKKINKQILRGIIRESLRDLMNEGAGAGYNVTFEGLKATDIRITGTEVKQNLHSTDKVVKFTASLAPSIVEWKAVGYYEGVTSEGIYYDNDLVEEFDELQKTVNGGSISGWVYYEDVNNSAPTWETEPATEEDVVRFINDCLSDFSFTTMYGGGWSHVNLTDPMVFENIEIQDNYNVTYVYINTIEISAPEITKTINWYFDNYLDFGKIYGGEEEMEETPEREPLQENKKQTIKLKESQLHRLVKEAINELDWKTYANASKKAQQWRDEHPFQYDRNRGMHFDSAAQNSFNQQHGIENLPDYGGEKGNINFSSFHGEPEISGSRNHDFGDGGGPFNLSHTVYHMGKKYGKDGGYGRTRMWDHPHETTPEEFYGDEEMGKKFRDAEQEVDNYRTGKYQYNNEKGWHLDESILRGVIRESLRNVLNKS